MKKKVKDLLNKFETGWFDVVITNPEAACASGECVCIKKGGKYFLVEVDGFKRCIFKDISGSVGGYNVYVFKALEALFLFGDITDKDWVDARKYLADADEQLSRSSKIARLKEDAKNLGFKVVPNEEEGHP